MIIDGDIKYWGELGRLNIKSSLISPTQHGLYVKPCCQMDDSNALLSEALHGRRHLGWRRLMGAAILDWQSDSHLTAGGI